jgi:hypothetical protein
MAPDPAGPAAILARWREAADAATPEPWELHTHGPSRCRDIWNDDAAWPIARDVRTEADGQLIVTARTALPLAIGALEAALAHHPQMITADGTVCARCSRRWPPTVWPCPEVRDITAALAGKEAD